MTQLKQIYAALDIASHEIRLVVGEFHESRFNVLRVERTRCSGVAHKEIVDEQAVVAAIIKLITKSSHALGYKIERVLVAIPAIGVERAAKRVSVPLEEGSKRVRLSHIQMGINEAVSYKPGDDVELVNIGCIKYITNGITSRKMPIGEICDVLTMNVDLLYAKKEIVYAYARCVEKAGLEIMDICLDAYAMAEEAAVFEQTVDKYVIQVDLDRQDTTLSLFTHGKLVSCEVLDSGYGKWLTDLKEAFGFPSDVGFRLLKNNLTFAKDMEEDAVIYLWNEEKVTKQLTMKQLYDCVKDDVDAWINAVNEACAPIVETGDGRYLMCGEGMEIQGLAERMGDFNALAKVYVPQIIGARDCSLAVCLGLFYNWKEQLEIRSDDRICADIRDITNGTQIGKRRATDDEGSFTKRLKSMLLSEK